MMQQQIQRYTVKVCQPLGLTNNEATFANVTLARPPWVPEQAPRKEIIADDKPVRLSDTDESARILLSFLTAEPNDIVEITKSMKSKGFLVTSETATKILKSLVKQGKVHSIASHSKQNSTGFFLTATAA